MLKQLSALILFSSLIFPQNSDSLLINNNQNKFDSSLVAITDTLSSDTTKVKEAIVKADTLIPIQGQPLSDVSNIISRITFLFENYRYTGDLLRSFNLNFIKDLGFIGYPNESFIYGVGNGGVSYMLDGVLWNNRYTNSLDLNLVQSEDIDSIEIVPSPRGFLYGPYNNPVTVNFITRDFIVPVPYARIKYYQGPNAEAMIDGRFSALLAERWNFSFEVTNRSIDSTYTNTEFSFWNVNAKLKYFLSNSVNLTAWYYYVDTKQGLNGGVNVDSIANIPSGYNINMYSLEAPVVYPNQKLDVLQNNFGLRTLAKPFDNSKLDLSVYYRYSQDELSNRTSQNYSMNEQTIAKTFASQLNYFQNIYFLKVDLLGVYEETKIDLDRQLSWDTTGSIKNWDKKSLSGSIILSTELLNDQFVPAIYYKYSNYDFSYMNPETKILNGFGIDLKLAINNAFSLYAGYSKTEQLLTSGDNVETFESAVNYSANNLFLNLKYFTRSGMYLPNVFIHPYEPDPHYILVGNLSGIGLNLNYYFWKILVETNSSYYFNGESIYQKEGTDDYQKGMLNIPDFQIDAGIYLKGNFFSDNLDLKAGFKFYYTGKINSTDYYYLGIVTVEPTNKLDFTLAGEIKKVAIFYFIWENLYYNQYYITPYYPMPDGNIRFGIAWELFN
jgi:hypothetical protein